MQGGNMVVSNNNKPDFDRIPTIGILPNQSLPTMYYENGTPRQLGGDEWEINSGAMSDANARRIVINNATGRIVVENWYPYNIDVYPYYDNNTGILEF